MKLFGYTEDKVMREVDLPVNTVVDKEIDPWRLDLCDPSPVLHQVGTELLRFRRLRDVAFFYKRESQAVVCLHDGMQTVALESTKHIFQARSTFPGFAIKAFQLNNSRNSNQSFAEHLLCYLSDLEQDAWYGKVAMCPPKRPEAVRLQGRDVLVDLAIESYNLVPGMPIFTGAMFEMVPTVMPTPEIVNWVFDRFSRFELLVTGSTIAGLLLERALHAVEVFIDADALKSFKYAVESSGEVSDWHDHGRDFSFHRAGQFYFVNGGRKLASLLSSMAAPGNSDVSMYSIDDGVYCTGPNQICATRIALYDAGQRIVRPVSRGSLRNHANGHLNVPKGMKAAEAIRPEPQKKRPDVGRSPDDTMPLWVHDMPMPFPAPQMVAPAHAA